LLLSVIHSAQPASFLFSFYSSRATRDLHSFPTRRSSDLVGPVRVGRGNAARERPGAPLVQEISLPREAAQSYELADTRLGSPPRSEEHTSELQSLTNLVCRLLLEKKKKNNRPRSANQKQT